MARFVMLAFASEDDEKAFVGEIRNTGSVSIRRSAFEEMHLGQFDRRDAEVTIIGYGEVTEAP